jgi:hypothetical protein
MRRKHRLSPRRRRGCGVVAAKDQAALARGGRYGGVDITISASE